MGQHAHFIERIWEASSGHFREKHLGIEFLEKPAVLT